MKKNRKGFTLIELLVVIAIIGLLSTLAIVSLNTARQKSRDAKRGADMRTMQSAIELYSNENGNAPALDANPTVAELETALGAFLVGGKVPVPPGNPANTTAAAWTDTAGDAYAYCEVGGSTYLLKAHNESDSAISGDLDFGADTSYGTAADCLAWDKAGTGFVSGVPAISCNETSGGSDNDFFCLGTP